MSAQSAAKRPGFPSGKWHPQAALLQGFRERLIFIWRRKQVRIWAVLSVAFLMCYLGGVVELRLGNPWPNVLRLVSGLVSVGNILFTVAVGIGLGMSQVKLLRSGRAAEGLVVGASDDGIDRLYTIYYEDGPGAYEVQITAKCKDPGRLQVGDSVTLIVGPPTTMGHQRIVLRRPT